jgi:hypothetical protein
MHKVFDNGGIAQSLLEISSPTKWSRTQRRRMSNKNTQPSKFKKKFAEEVQLGPHSAKIFEQSVCGRDDQERVQLQATQPDVKEGDFEKLMSAIPEPWVQDKRFSLQGFTKFKHPATPTGALDEDSMESCTRSPLTLRS